MDISDQTPAVFIWLIIRLIQLIFSAGTIFFSKKNQPTVFFSRLIIPTEQGHHLCHAVGKRQHHPSGNGRYDNPPSMYGFDETQVQFHPLRDENHDRGLDLEAAQASEGHDPNARDRGHSLHKAARRSIAWDDRQLLYDASRRPEDDDYLRANSVTMIGNVGYATLYHDVGTRP
jgi:hypothetical protein